RGGGGPEATASGRSLRSSFHCERPWVALTRVREGLWSVRSNTGTSGWPTPSADQLAPRLEVTYTPVSVAMNNRLVFSGSTSRSLTGMSGRLPSIAVHLVLWL